MCPRYNCHPYQRLSWETQSSLAQRFSPQISVLMVCGVGALGEIAGINALTKEGLPEAFSGFIGRGRHRGLSWRTCGLHQVTTTTTTL